ncbi:Endochitinase B [Cytospora mali]|uniref:chitinase n=1 Tax=Cytospora mali TaxID=578113 RepID=A0A194V3H6_CYTMA|nr:Endochitinase B [Valsa mali var. pyri (nom. inval.)]
MHLKQKHPHLQVILSIGGGASSQAFSTVSASAVLRDNFARSARGLVEASGLDGIDIVWQYPTDPQQGANFLALLAAVRLYLPEEHYLLTAALPASCTILANIDLHRAADYLDLLNLMAYDFYGPWTPRSGHHAQLYPSSNDDDTSGSSSVSYALSRGFPAQKTLLGIPLFGRSFVGVPGPGHMSKGSAPGSNGDGTFDYNQLPRKGTKEQIDKRACAAFCVGGDGGFVSYDNQDTVKQKAAFCRQKGLGGLFYWTGPADATDSKRSLVAAGFRALHSS